MRCLRLPFAGALLASSILATLAHADPRRDPVAAEAIFDEARRLMGQGDYASACPKFADSEALDPAPGTALNLANCYEKAGKRATAWAAYKTAQAVAERAGQRDRAVIATKKVAEIEPTLSRLTLSVPEASQTADLKISFDGDVVEAAGLGVAVPRDGGGHDIAATAPGKVPWKSHVELQESGQTLVVEVPPLQDASSPVASVPAATPEPAPAPVVAPAIPPDKPAGQAQRIGGIVVGGVAIAGLAFGAFAGLKASSKYSDAKSECGGTGCDSSHRSAGFALRDAASSWATASTIAFVAGGAVLAAGAVLFFTAPHERTGASAALVLAPTTGGAAVSVAGRF